MSIRKIATKEIRYRGAVTLTFHVSSLDASITWYEEILGCRLIRREEDTGWCELAGPLANILIGLRQSEIAPLKGGCIPALEIEDLDAARARLEASKVRFDGPTIDLPGLEKLATFYDPDGNSWRLRENLRRPEGAAR